MLKQLLCLVSIINTTHAQEMWSNWCGNQVCKVQKIYYPQTLEQLQENVLNAAMNKYTIRAFGTGFSFSDLVCTNGALITLQYLNKILSLDLEKKLVRVEAGITLKELNNFLDSQNLTLPNQAAVADITLGGAISTAVHGTGKTGTLSSFIVAIDIVTADGLLQTFTAKSNPEYFNAAIVSLGALGIIYSVTLQCEDLFWVTSHQEAVELDYFLANYLILKNQNDFSQFFYNTKTKQVIISSCNRIQQALTINKPTVKCFEAQANYQIQENDREFVVQEIAVPMNYLPQALIETQNLMLAYQQNGIAFEDDIVIRFVQTDNGYLSPASAQDSAYLNVAIVAQGSYLDFCRDFEDAMLALNGRPHWGKINFVNYTKALNAYGEKLTKFIAIKNALDPQGVFSNDYIQKICA